jgi:hypothetical protein
MREEQNDSLLWSRCPVEGKPYQATWTPHSAGRALPAIPASPAALEILYFCDAHGKLFSDDNKQASCPSRLGELKNSIASDALMLAGGDDHGSGNPWDTFLADGADHSPCYFLYEAAGLDAFTIGNHDLDWGADALARVLEATSIPVVVSNLKADSPLQHVTYPAIVFEFQDKLVGLLGLANYSDVLEAKSLFRDPSNALKPYLADLEDRVNCLIVISHLGFEYQKPVDDHEILKQVSENTLVCGSHSHLTIPDLEGKDNEQNYLQSSSQFQVYGHAQWTSDSFWKIKNVPIAHLLLLTPTKEDMLAKSSLKSELKRRGQVSFSHRSFKAENDPGDRYRKENPRLNWSCDALRSTAQTLHREASPFIVGLCARFLGNAQLNGELDISDWYLNFPYGDRLSSFLVPWDILPALLQGNAQRLLKPAYYLESTGWLQFDHSLRQSINFDENSATIEDFSLYGEPFEPGKHDKLRLFTQAYVACGSGGYRHCFNTLGIEPEDIQIYPFSLRETLWTHAGANGPTTEDPLDGRLTINLEF